LQWDIGVQFLAGAENFPFVSIYRPPVGPTQPSFEWVHKWSFFPWAESGQGMKMFTAHQLTMKVKNVFKYTSNPPYIFMA
jgi:hypothetical protein